MLRRHFVTVYGESPVVGRQSVVSAALTWGLTSSLFNHPRARNAHPATDGVRRRKASVCSKTTRPRRKATAGPHCRSRRAAGPQILGGSHLSGAGHGHLARPVVISTGRDD